MTADDQTYPVASDLAPNGVLRASINLGNPVLAQGTPASPAGVTVDIANEVGKKLGLPVELTCFDAARKSFEALRTGEADLSFMAIEPAREVEVAFTTPYVVIEGVFAVPDDSDLTVPGELDRPGVQIGVKQGSAYDLFLTRTLQHATLVRGSEGTTVFLADGLDAAAGIRQPVTAFVAANPGLRLIEECFMQIQQALAVRRTCRPETVAYMAELVEDLKASGFVADALARSGQDGVSLAPPAG